MPVLSDFQLLLFDVDKTLTNTQREISPTVKHALQELTKRKMQIGVSTARPYPMLKNSILPLFSADALHVMNSGAQVMTSEGKVLFERLISVETMSSLTTELRRVRADFFVCGTECVYATENLKPNLENHVWKAQVSTMDALPNQAMPLISIVQLTPEINTVLADFPNLTIKRMLSHLGLPYCDITAAGITKDVGVRELSRLSGIPTSKMVGFGDSENDLEFLQAVGFAVVMGNGTDELKKHADRVIGNTDEDGLGIYLTNILKGQPL